MLIYISESSGYAYVAIMSSCHGGADCGCILRSRLPGKSGKRLEDYEEKQAKKLKSKFKNKNWGIDIIKWKVYHIHIKYIGME